jgi:GT2 family glycosyltransferase
MQACVIIPVWNGVASIGDCLQTLLDTADARLETVVCVDNASTDGSAELIAARFPQVRLLRQPVNLGFAGGVNAGAAASQAEMIVLLNQDCLVQPGWLDGFSQVLQDQPDCGAVGCTVLAADGAVNHTGARITHPLGYGQHLTEPLASAPYPVEYATGAFFACRRSAWERLGGMDEQFYPAYYEESDFCLRLRQHGYHVRVAPAVQATHFFTSREWQRDPVLHGAQQHRSRYRFVCKQFTAVELLDFFAAELVAAADEPYFHQAIGRTLASRDLLRRLPELTAARGGQFAAGADLPFARVAAVKFEAIYAAALQRTRRLAAPGEDTGVAAFEQWQQAVATLRGDLVALAARQDETAVRDRQIAALTAARRLYEETVALPAPKGVWLWRMRQTLQHLSRQTALLSATQAHLIATHEQSISRLDLFETTVNQRLAWLEQRLDLIETQLTHFEHQRRVDDLLATYEHF